MSRIRSQRSAPRSRRSLRKHAAFIALVAFVAFGGLVGCRSAYTVAVNSASVHIDEARALGAETKAPFEYFAARDHFHRAELAASGVGDGDAVEQAELADLYAQRAIDSSRGPSRGRASTASVPGPSSIEITRNAAENGAKAGSEAAPASAPDGGSARPSDEDGGGDS